VGELAALGCAVLWAGSTVAMRSQTGRVPVLALNANRALFASLIYLVLLAALFLGERLSAQIALGTALSVAGIWLVL